VVGRILMPDLKRKISVSSKRQSRCGKGTMKSARIERHIPSPRLPIALEGISREKSEGGELSVDFLRMLTSIQRQTSTADREAASPKLGRVGNC
jgi:hypothetical protein